MIKTTIVNNLDAAAELVGSLAGMSEGLDSDEYMNRLIEQAHGKATNAFDVAAAATAATGRLQHMYEFGTAGITRGPVKFPDPTSAAARLWTHTVVKTTGGAEIGFNFRPAINRNPQPTTRDTGVASKYLRKLSRRKYVFWNKAFVTETGQTVEIHAKNSDYLFVPFNNNPPRNPLNRKGFVMWNSKALGPIRAVPGETLKGNFTTFWTTWWSNQGEKVFDKSMVTEVNKDVRKATRLAEKKAATHGLKPAAANNPNATANKARQTARKEFK
jgi:hypothetical protein